MSLEELKPKIERCIRAFPDFPKKGILFRDIMPLFEEPILVQKLCVAIAQHAKTLRPPVSAVTALEARGFLFGPQIAAALNVPFVAIRKKGKLPGQTIQATYMKEYGPDVMEIQKDALKRGANVLVFDDLIATGGTLKAAVELVEEAGAIVAETFCLIELDELKGRAVIPSHVPQYTLCHF